MAIWGMGVMMGPIMGPSLGAWLTETYSWHWVFFVNTIRHLHRARLMIFMDETKKTIELRFDWFGFTALAQRDRRLQLALDRGEQLGWLESNEIIAEFIIAGRLLLLPRTSLTRPSLHPVRAVQGQEFRRRLRVHGRDGAGAGPPWPFPRRSCTA